MNRWREENGGIYVLIFTVVPVSKARLNVTPAGTVNELTLIVVHVMASATSSNDEIVPVQLLPLGAAVTRRDTAAVAARA